MMFDIDPSTFEFLATAKRIYDAGLMDSVLETCGNWEVCEDCYSLAWEGIYRIFKEFRQYYNEEAVIETMVFFDPVISEFYRLCALHEAKTGVDKDHSPLRKEGEQGVYRCFCLDAYDYDVQLYDGEYGKPRLVVLPGEEFYGHTELPEALADVRDTLEAHCARLKKALAEETSDAPETTEQEAA